MFAFKIRVEITRTKLSASFSNVDNSNFSDWRFCSHTEYTVVRPAQYRPPFTPPPHIPPPIGHFQVRNKVFLGYMTPFAAGFSSVPRSAVLRGTAVYKPLHGRRYSRYLGFELALTSHRLPTDLEIELCIAMQPWPS